MSFRPVKPRVYGSTKALVATLIDAAGGAKGAAFLIERGLSQTYGYADEAVPDAQITLDAARRLALCANDGEGSPALAQLCAADVGGVFVPGAAPSDSIAELMAKGETQRGRLMADFIRAQDREGFGGAKTPDLLREFDALIETLVAVRKKMATA